MSQLLRDHSERQKTDEQLQTKLIYQTNEIEGECILLNVLPVKLDSLKYLVYCIMSVILLGIPVLIVYWYPNIKKQFYTETSLEEATHFCVKNYDNVYTITKKKQDNFQISEGKTMKFTYFENRYLKYTIHKNVVKVLIFDFEDRIKSIACNSTEKGLSNQMSYKLKQNYGQGAMIINKPSLVAVFFKEVFRPLYIFIILSVLVWIIDEYYYYSWIILFTAIVSIGISLYETYTLNQKIFAMAYYETQVNILRQGYVSKRSSLDVVPGDIVFLKDPIKIPFEGVILEGSALINECALTGESVPIVKKASTNQSYKKGNIDKSSIIFQGTTLLQANNKKQMNQFEQYRLQFGIPVCVIRTNFVTMKGQLIRLISFPKQRQNIFQKQSLKFLSFLFIFALISYGLLLIKLNKYLTGYDKIMKLLDLITITVPPGLPISMTVGIVLAIEKMKKQNIFCISPDKVIMGGMVDFVCFDKTGTLTEDYMDFYSYIPCVSKQFQKEIDHQTKQKISLKQLTVSNPNLTAVIVNMASNHSVVRLQTSDELIGDPMQVKLLQFAQFNLTKTLANPEIVHSVQNNEGNRIDVYRRFEFDSEIQRMGVIAKTTEQQCLHIFMKGSPEMMLKIMSNDSIPKNYHEILKKYASMGLRVLAIASKKLDLTLQQIKTVSLDQVENNLQFNGFEVFENKLKPETHQAITQLFEAEIPCVMITGDNSLTGTNIAYKCGISDESKNTIIIDYSDGHLTQQNFIYYDDQKQKNEKSYLSQAHKNQLYQIETVNFEEKKTNYLTYLEKQNEAFFLKMCERAKKQNKQYTVTGNAFNYLFPGSIQSISINAAAFLTCVRVYARAKPNQKAKIVMAYQSCGKTTAMCGDGANDCGALKQADAGLSLSQAQASISSPFTSKVPNISSMVILLKQCRAGLVTNFSLFNIMAMYSLVQYTTTILCSFYFVYPAPFQFLYWDLGCNFFFFITLGYTGTAQKLSCHKPSASLFKFSNLFYVIFMTFVQFIGQLIILFGLIQIYAEQTDYAEHGSIQVNLEYYLQNGFNEQSQESSALFLFSNYMYIFSLLAFCISHPWRKQFYTNHIFLGILILVLLYSSVLVLSPQDRPQIFHIKYLDSIEFNWFIFEMSLLFGFFIYLNQKYLLQPLFCWLRLEYPHKKWI